jgi:hypothetical protein
VRAFTKPAQRAVDLWEAEQAHRDQLDRIEPLQVA